MGRAFTLVELLIVIVVIAILATVVVVGFNGIRARAVDSAVRNTLSSAIKTFETKKIENSVYPASLSAAGLESTDTVTLQHTGTDTSYCISGTSPRSDTIGYRVTHDNPDIRQGVCDGHLGPGENPEDQEEAFSFATTVHADGPLGFQIHVGEDWTVAELSWAAQTDIQSYEVQSRNPYYAPDHVYGAWNYRRLSDGFGSASAGTSGYSGAIPNTQTSLSWSFNLSGVPSSPGQTVEYRMRYRGTDNTYSDWATIVLAHPVQGADDLRGPTHFTATPNENYSNVTLSWDSLKNFAPDMNKVRIEVQSRNPYYPPGTTNGEWSYRRQSDGWGYQSATYPGYSGLVSHSATSLTWTNNITAVPASAGQTIEYRTRVRVSGQDSSIYYYSDWVTIALAYPVQGDADVPNITGFTVTPSAGYANVAIAWNQAPNFAPNMNSVRVEVQSRNTYYPSDTTNGEWNYRRRSDGFGYQSATHNDYSGMVSPSATSLTWTSSPTAVPAAGQAVEYRIRIRVAGQASSINYYSDWQSAQVTR